MLLHQKSRWVGNCIFVREQSSLIFTLLFIYTTDEFSAIEKRKVGLYEVTQNNAKIKGPQLLMYTCSWTAPLTGVGLNTKYPHSHDSQRHICNSSLSPNLRLVYSTHFALPPRCRVGSSHLTSTNLNCCFPDCTSYPSPSSSLGLPFYLLLCWKQVKNNKNLWDYIVCLLLQQQILSFQSSKCSWNPPLFNTPSLPSWSVSLAPT